MPCWYSGTSLISLGWSPVSEVDTLLAREFDLDGVIHLDHAGVGPWSRRCADAVCGFARANASTSYLGRFGDWMETDARLRTRLQALIGAEAADDIALLPNTSTGLSLIARGLEWHAGDRIVYLAEEFISNRLPWQALAGFGVECVEVVPADGESRESAIEAACDDRTRLLSVSTVQYGTGWRMDLARLGRFCRDAGILMCVDAIQSLGALRFDAEANHADFVVSGAHKWMMAPFGVALFHCRPELRDRLALQAHGWHTVADPMSFAGTLDSIEASARRFEPGTANLAGIMGFEAALSLHDEIGAAEIERRVLRNAAWLAERLEARPGVELVSSREPDRFGGSVCARIAGRDHAEIVKTLQLDHGVLCAARGPSLRFSPHCHNTVDQLDLALAAFDVVMAA